MKVGFMRVYTMIAYIRTLHRLNLATWDDVEAAMEMIKEFV